jgi:putative copper resistance protein D
VTFLVVVRFLHLGAMTLLIGAFGFALLVARPAFRKARAEGAPAVQAFDRLLLRLASASLGAALVSALLWLLGQTVIAAGKPLGEALTPEVLGRMLTKTQFGHVWQLRTGALLLLGALLLFREGERGPKDWLNLRLQGLVVAGAVLAGVAWMGHAAATAGTPRLYHLAADVGHLLASGLWLGGLLPLALLLGRLRRSPHPPAGAVAAEATRRFSALGLAAVSAIIATGLVNAWMLVGGFPRLVGTPYGRLLLVKLGLLVPLIGVAAVNLRRLKPAIAAAAAGNRRDTLPTLLTRLRRNVLIEAALGGLVLLVTGALGVTPPARHPAPLRPSSIRLSWEATKTTPGIEPRLIAGAVPVTGPNPRCRNHEY